MIAGAGHLERIELEAAEPIDHAQDRFRLRRQCARRIEQLTTDQEASRMVGREAEVGERGWHRRGLSQPVPAPVQ